MKLALVLPGPLDRRSGGYSYDLDWHDHLVAEGHDVAVWSLPAGAKAAKVLAQHLANEHQDVVVFDALVHLDVGLWLVNNARTKRSPWVALVHHLAWLEAPEPTRATPRQKEHERRFLEVMDGYLFNSEDTRRSVADLRGPAEFRPSLVNRPPLRLPPLAPRQRSATAHLLFLANLTPRKNLHGLLAALGSLTRRRPEVPWRLTVAGNPSFDPVYTRTCQAQAEREGLSHRVTWAGRVEGERLEALWATADLLAVPSFHEGWGMVYGEALARGVVPLTGHQGGGPEVVGSAGLRADPRSPDDVARVLEAFLTEADREEWSRRARRRGEYLAESLTGFAGLGEFLASLIAPPATHATLDFDAYLEAKATVDTRSLHRGVLEAAWGEAAPAHVLELGAGTGTMARRLRTWGRVGPRTRYEMVDQRPEGLELARVLAADHFDPGFLVTRQSDLQSLLDADPRPDQPRPDVVVAHAVLDLFDPGPTARGLARLGAQRYWLTHIFDGHTAWEPVLDPDLDDALVAAYHRTMDERAGAGEGSSRTGRQWLSALPAAGLTVVAAASSDWIVRPEGGHYPASEAVFLTSLLHFFRSSLTGRDDVDQKGLDWWLAARQRHIEQAKAVFLAHQLDLAAVRKT